METKSDPAASTGRMKFEAVVAEVDQIHAMPPAWRRRAADELKRNVFKRLPRGEDPTPWLGLVRQAY